MRESRTLAALLVAALVPAGCGDGTGPQINLTEAEVMEMFMVLSGFLDIGEAGFTHDHATAVMSTASGTFGFTESCPQGGSMDVIMTEPDNETEPVDMDFTFNACRSEGYTFGGGLNILASGTFTDTSFSLAFQWRGDLNVTAPSGKSGDCRIDLNQQSSFNTSTFSGSSSVTGTACGRRINQTHSF